MQVIPSSHPHSKAMQYIPVPPNPLLGRQAEVEEIRLLLCEHEVHLLTISGPAGVGKTHLALVVAALVADSFVDGIFFIDLAAIRDVDLLVPTIASVFGRDEQSSSRRDNRSNEAHLQTYLCDKRLLLFLDNFEQLLPASAVLASLLSIHPKLTILVTSRATLNIRGEHEFRVAPLALPENYSDAASLRQSATVQLFLQRAQSVNQHFQLTSNNTPVLAEICRQLDGLPLAIELAATRARLFSPQQILKRLQNKLEFLTHGASDLPFRQQTLRNTLQWSYELLRPEEQKLFRLCAIVSGTCTLEVLEALSSMNTTHLINTVNILINHSLLQQSVEDNRNISWRMLATLRDFGLELLAAHEELETVQERYVNYYQSLAVEAEQKLLGLEQSVWQARIRAEYENLQQALHWLIEQGREHEASIIGKALYLSSFLCRHIFEEFSWLERHLTDHAHTQLSARAKALHYFGASAFFESQPLKARGYLEESLRLYQELEESEEFARVACMLGYVTFALKDYSVARKWTKIAFTLFKDHTDSAYQEGCSYAAIILALVALCEKQYQRSSVFAEEALKRFKELQDERGTTTALCVLAHACYGLHNLDTARILLEKALELALRAELLSLVACCAHLLGTIVARQNSPELAVMFWGATQLLYIENAERLHQEQILALLPLDEHGEVVDMVRVQLGDKDFQSLWDRGRQTTIQQCLQEEKEQSQKLTPLSHLSSLSPLTEREVEVLCLVATGLTDAQVANHLSLSTRTISWHLASIYAKIHVSSRVAATRYAVEHQLPIPQMFDEQVSGW